MVHADAMTESIISVDSAYDSGAESTAASPSNAPQVTFTQAHLDYINAKLDKASPQEILQWAVITLPGLYQTTALGLSGMVTLDILSHLPGGNVPLVFIDTLYHFNETLELLDRARARYPETQWHVYRPEGAATAAEFEARHGERLWERDEHLYDYLVKVEPSRRAYQELGVRAVLTGRRRSQGASRSHLNIVDIDTDGTIKVNPLANWSFSQVQEYIKAHDVPFNALLDKGYRSVGDWHSTQPVAAGEDERAGRWKGRDKTECGLHEQSKFYQYLKRMEAERSAASVVQAH